MCKMSDVQCPKCKVQPDKTEVWYCTCHTEYNPLKTLGVCPRCFKQWPKVQCPNCEKWSPIEDWYTEAKKLLKSI
jgi:hypothetical protein